MARTRPSIFALVLESALIAALLNALLELFLTLRHTHYQYGGTARFVGILTSLWMLAGLAVGLVEGPIASALVSSGAVGMVRSMIRRVRADEPYDRVIAASLLAGCVVLVGFGVWVTALIFGIVAPAHRKLVASIVCGTFVLVSVPVFFLFSFPVERVTVILVRLLPRWRRLPATAVLGLLASGVALVVAIGFVRSRIDWRELHLGAPIMGTLFLIVQLTWLYLLHGPLRPLARWDVIVAVAAVSLLLPFVTLRDAPPAGPRALVDNSVAGSTLAVLVQKLYDDDHDGFSRVLGGGDCDDDNPRVHPGARDWPDDGIDENCLGGDAHHQPPLAPPVHAPGGFVFRGNVVFLFIDTLRADRLNARLTPNLDALARGGVRFTHAYAQAPGTARSFPSLATSRLPSAVQWEDSFQDFPSVTLDNHTVFEALEKAGYHTVGIASHFYFSVPGVTQGFEELDNSGAPSSEDARLDVSSPRIIARVERLLPRLAAEQRPWAMLLHLSDPHSVYMPHPEVRHGRPAPTELSDEYDEEVQFLDEQLARLLAMFEKERVMVVVFADHGEAFGLHLVDGEANFRHGSSLYEELLRVPLILAAPGLAPRVIDQPVELIDVAPTVLDVLGVPIPSTFRGRSLAGALVGAPLAPAPVHAELLPQPSWNVGARMLLDADGHSKMIYRLTQPRFEVYDVAADPDEKHDLSVARPELTARLHREMVEWQDSPP